MERSSRRALKWVRPTIALATAAVLAAACSTGTDTPSSSSTGGDSSGVDTLAFVNPASANSYQISFQCGIVQGAKAAGFNLISVADDSTFTPQAQIPLLQAASAKNPKALITDPTNSTAITPTLNQVKGRGAKVVIYDNPLDDKTVAAGLVQSDSFAGGVTLANEVVKDTGGNAEILLIDIQPGALASNERIEGFQSVIKNHPGIKTYGPFFDNFTASKDAAIVDAALAAHPKISLVVPSYNSAANAAVQELKARNKLGAVKVATFDADPQIVDYVRQGTVTAVVSQQPYLQAQQALQIAKDSIQGKPVTYLHNLGMVLINKANVDTDAAKPGLYTNKSCAQ